MRTRFLLFFSARNPLGPHEQLPVLLGFHGGNLEKLETLPFRTEKLSRQIYERSGRDVALLRCPAKSGLRDGCLLSYLFIYFSQ